MKYRFVTAAAVLFTWLFLYLIGLTSNSYALFVPLAVLAFFQIGEKRISKHFSPKK